MKSEILVWCACFKTKKGKKLEWIYGGSNATEQGLKDRVKRILKENPKLRLYGGPMLSPHF
jgi:hypothetical protein